MARVSRINKLINDKCKQKTESLMVGAVYFLSSFHDEQGAFVRVLNKSTEKNSCGWSSSVTVEVTEIVTGRTKDSFHERYPFGPSKKGVSGAWSGE